MPIERADLINQAERYGWEATDPQAVRFLSLWPQIRLEKARNWTQLARMDRAGAQVLN
jgi:hypothetical protein